MLASVTAQSNLGPEGIDKAFIRISEVASGGNRQNAVSRLRAP